MLQLDHVTCSLLNREERERNYEKRNDSRRQFVPSSIIVDLSDQIFSKNLESVTLFIDSLPNFSSLSFALILKPV